MSYFLQTRGNRSKGLGARGGGQQRPTQAPRGGSGLRAPGRSGGGGQIQKQRPAAVQQQKQRPAVVQQKQRSAPNPQQQQRVVAGISMEEVLADLQILQDQQNESERRLKAARVTKQKRLEQHAAMEAQLERLKYENGQQRAELQRANVLLSRGQRQLAEARVDAERAGVDLREFDHKVNKCLEVKRTLQAYERKNEVMLEELRKKLSFLEHLADEAKEQYDAAQAEYDKIKKYEESLRQSIKAEAEIQQRVAKETVEVRAASAALEKKLDLGQKKETELKRAEESIRKNSEDQQAHHTTAMAALQERQEKLNRRKEELAQKKARLKESAAKKTQDLHQVWHRAIEIQKAEEHPASLPPSEANVPPVLDLDRIRESVQAATAAAVEETKAKEELQSTVEALRAQLPKLKTEQAASSERIKELEAANDKGRKVEQERSEAITAMKTELDDVKKQIAEKDQKVQELRAARAQELTELKQRLAETTLTLETRQKQLSSVVQEDKDVDAKLVQLQATYVELKEKDDAALAAKNGEVEEIKKKIAELEESTRELEELGYRRKIETYEREIEKMEKECPLLKTVKFTYRPELRSTQQAEIDLKDFIAACKKRTRQEALDRKIAAREKKDARKRKSKQHQQHEVESSQLSAGEDSAEDQHRGHMKKKKEPVVVKAKAGQISAVKPRALLDTFSQDDGEDAVSTEDIDDADEDADVAAADPETTGLPEDTIDDDDDADDADVEDEIQFTQPSEMQPEYTDIDEPMQQSQSKSVHWQDEDASVADETLVEDDLPPAKPLKPAKQARRKTFGSSKNSISSHSTVPTSNKSPLEGSLDEPAKDDHRAANAHSKSSKPVKQSKDHRSAKASSSRDKSKHTGSVATKKKEGDYMGILARDLVGTDGGKKTSESAVSHSIDAKSSSVGATSKHPAARGRSQSRDERRDQSKKTSRSRSIDPSKEKIRDSSIDANKEKTRDSSIERRSKKRRDDSSTKRRTNKGRDDSSTERRSKKSRDSSTEPSKKQRHEGPSDARKEKPLLVRDKKSSSNSYRDESQERPEKKGKQGRSAVAAPASSSSVGSKSSKNSRPAKSTASTASVSSKSSKRSKPSGSSASVSSNKSSKKHGTDASITSKSSSKNRGGSKQLKPALKKTSSSKHRTQHQQQASGCPSQESKPKGGRRRGPKTLPTEGQKVSKKPRLDADDYAFNFSG